MSEMLFDAVDFATQAHRNQYRKATRIPYIIHPLEVARVLLEAGCDETLATAAVLHDIVEDTHITLEDVRARFGPTVAELVAAATEPDKVNPWEYRKRDTLARLEDLPIPALLIHVADKLINIREIRADLARHGDAVWTRFNRGREQQEWYYRELAAIFARRLTDSPGLELARDFRAEVSAVFGPPPDRPEA